MIQWFSPNSKWWNLPLGGLKSFFSGILVHSRCLRASVSRFRRKICLWIIICPVSVREKQTSPPSKKKNPLNSGIFWPILVPPPKKKAKKKEISSPLLMSFSYCLLLQRSPWRSSQEWRPPLVPASEGELQGKECGFINSKPRMGSRGKAAGSELPAGAAAAPTLPRNSEMIPALVVFFLLSCPLSLCQQRRIGKGFEFWFNSGLIWI